MRRYIEVPFRLLNIEEEGFHVLIKGKINDMEANFLIDTGASRSVFSLRVVERLMGKDSLEKKEGITAGVGGDDLESFVFPMERLELGEVCLYDYQAVALDLDSIHDNYEKLGLPFIDGVIGGDLLVELKATINYRLRKIRLTPPKRRR